MNELQSLEKLWPLIAGIAVLWARIEVGQALNRANINALWARRKEERSETADALGKLREDHREMRKELRDEMKALRDLFERYHGAGK